MKLNKNNINRINELNAILNKSYSTALVKGVAAGGILGGAITPIVPYLYSKTIANPNIEDTENWRKADLEAVKELAGKGALGGTIIGGGLNVLDLARQKIKAKKELKALQSLKTANAKDYAFNGLLGAGIGGGAGLLANAVLGRKLLDKRLLLGGLGVGGALGLYTGRLVSRERDAQEVSQRTLEDSLQRDENGNIIYGKNGLPLIEEGVYGGMREALPLPAKVETMDIGPANKHKKFLKSFLGMNAISSANRHDIRGVVFNQKPDDIFYYYDNGRKIPVDFRELDNGQWGFQYELEGDYGNEDTRTNRHGTIDRGPFNITSVWTINRNQVDRKSLSKGRMGKPLNEGDEDRAPYSDLLNDVIHFSNKDSKVPDKKIFYRLDNRDKRYTNTDNLKKIVQSLVTHARDYHGDLGTWSLTPKWLQNLLNFLGLKSYPQASCQTLTDWSDNGLRSEGLLPAPTSTKYFYRYTPALASSYSSKNTGIEAYGPWRSTSELMKNHRQGIESPWLEGPAYSKPFGPIAYILKNMKKEKKS